MPSPRLDNLENILEEIEKTFTVEFEPLDVDGQILEMLTIANMPGHLDSLLAKKAIREPLRDLPLWAKIWPASLVLGRFLRKFEPQGKTMLEIGAGMGACGLIAARHGFKSIICADNNRDALNFAAANILRNSLENIVSTRYLDLENPRPGDDCRFDVIAASEMLYLDDLHRPLIKFVERRLAAGGRAFFCSDLARARSRFKKMAAARFKITDGNIGVKSRDEEGQEQRRVYNILILERPE